MIASHEHQQGPRRIVYVVNVSWFFISHRLQLARAALAAGYEVHVATSVASLADAERIRASGITLHDVPIGRADTGLLYDLRTIVVLTELFRRLRPDLVHLVAMKAVAFGGIAARIARVPGVVIAIAGLGTGFASEGGFRASARRHLLTLLLRVAIPRQGSRVIFQNDEDMRVLVENGVVLRSSARLIPGAGVDLAEFRKLPPPPPPVRVILPARMLREKGVVVFAEAARRLREAHPTARFLLAGDLDPANPGSLTRAEIDALTRATDNVAWLGHVDDMPALLAACHVVCLPTWYGEGIPKALIEGAAAGRPLVTTDIPGCRDICADGVNGLLVPARNVEALTAALHQLLADDRLRATLGDAGPARVADRFSLQAIVRMTLEVYGDCLTGRTRPTGPHA